MIGKMIYDISLDEMKEATQEDVDRMFLSLQTSGKMVRILRKIKPELIPPPSYDRSFVNQLNDKLNKYMKENGID